MIKKIFEVLTRLKNRKLKKKNEVIKKYKRN